MKTVSDRDIENFYKLLELPFNAPQAEIKSAYRSLARQYHPDRFIGEPNKLKESEEYLKEINVAYEFLKTYHPSPQKTDVFSRSSSSSPSSSNSSTVGVKTSRTPTSRTPKTLVEEAQHLRSIGNLEEALMTLDTAIALQDDYYPAYYLRSEVRLAMGNPYGCQQDQRRAKHFHWVYKTEGRQIDSPAASASVKTQATKAAAQAKVAKTAAQTAVDSVFKPSRTTDFQSKNSQTKSSQVKTDQTDSPKSKSPQPQLLQKFMGHVDSISQILFVNRSLVSASYDGSVRIWNIETGELQGSLTVGAAVTAIAASPNSNLFITGDRSGKIKMWNLLERKLLRSIPLHTGKVTGVHFTQNGKSFVTTGEDGILKIFQLNPASLRHTVQIAKLPIFSSGIVRDQIFTTTPDSKLSVIMNGNVIRSEELSSPLCKTLAVSHDRDWVGVGDDRGSIHCFDRQGHLLKSVAAFPDGVITSMAFIYCGDRLLVSSESGKVKMWDVKNWTVETEWETGTAGVSAIAVSSSEKIAIANHNTLQTWRLPQL
jgi:COMPASS component SWD3